MAGGIPRHHAGGAFMQKPSAGSKSQYLKNAARKGMRAKRMVRIQAKATGVRKMQKHWTNSDIPQSYT